jgi:very-short-patch-repair endonuclease
MDEFISILRDEKLPIPVKEYKFCKGRRWRFDYAFVKQKIAVEQDGGIWSGGRHSRGSGIIKDMEKFNKAVILGWRVLHYTPQQMTSEAINDIKEIFNKGRQIN